MTDLVSYVDNCVELAQANGMSPEYASVLRVKQDVAIVVSHGEPSDLVIPANALWIVADTGSVDYKKMLRRASKSPTAPYNHTWQQVTVFDDVLLPQTWDEADLPEPLLITGSGGTLSGPLYPHSGPYEPEEVFPKSVLDGEITQLRNNFFTMYQNMNNRVLTVDSKARSLEVSQGLIGDRISALESLGTSITSKVFLKTTPSRVWYLNHNTGVELSYVLCLTEHGEIICPDSMGPDEEDSSNTLKVVFSAPVSGLAIALLFPLPPESQSS